jgi:hypothetical protein
MLAKAALNTAAQLVPPEQRFWERYSPHGEARFSGLSSFVLHAAIIGPLLILGWFGISFGAPPPDPALKAVRLLEEPGGGGKPGGVKDGPAGGARESGETESGGSPLGDPDPPDPKLTLTEIKDVGAVLPDAYKTDPVVQARIKAGDSRMLVYSRVDKQVTDALNAGVRAGQGKAGTGTGGGAGDGVGPGVGSGRGEGNTSLTEREKRLFRWKIDFGQRWSSDPQAVQNYMQTLEGLGAFVALPAAPGSRQFRIIRKLLQKPVQFTNETLSQTECLYWYEQNQQVVRDVTNYLGLPPSAGYIILLPQFREKEMSEAERKFKGARPSDIFETRFKVSREGGGYKVDVMSQTLMSEVPPEMRGR